MGLDLGMREYQYISLVQVAFMLWNNVLLAAKWFRIVFSQVTLFFPPQIILVTVTHGTEPPPTAFYYCDWELRPHPLHQPALPAQLACCNLLRCVARKAYAPSLWLPFPIVPIWPMLLPSPPSSVGSTTLLFLQPGSCPAGWLLKAPCSCHQSWLTVKVLPKSNWKDILFCLPKWQVFQPTLE